MKAYSVSSERRRLIAAELQELAKAVNPQGDFAGKYFPQLAQCAGTEDPAQIQAWVVAWVNTKFADDSDGDENYNFRAAVAKLFEPFPNSGPRANFGERRNAAGKCLGVIPETFRKAKPGGSHFEHFLRRIADSMPAVEPAPPADFPRRRPARRLLAVSLVLAIAAVLIVFVATRSGSNVDRAVDGTSALTSLVDSTVGPTTEVAPSSTVAMSTTTVEMRRPCGATTQELLNTASEVDRQRLANAAAAIDLAVQEGECPTSAMQEFGGQLAVQQLSDADGDSIGVLVVSSDLVVPPATPLRLTFSQWSAYKETSGLNGENAATVISGVPIAVRVEDGWSLIDLSLGGMLVGKRPDGPHFWLPHQVRPEWERRGGLGGELGAPTSGLYQLEDSVAVLEFEHGQMSAPGVEAYAGDLTHLEVVVVGETEALAALAALGDVNRGIIEQAAGPTSWWIEDGKRYWIPDGDTWTCLGGEAAVVARRIPSWTVSALPDSGENASCE
ncbi:MAG: hypothetical protein ABMA25_00040 [Ilumatobacteraceae bacterium]